MARMVGSWFGNSKIKFLVEWWKGPYNIKGLSPPLSILYGCHTNGNTAAAARVIGGVVVGSVLDG